MAILMVGRLSEVQSGVAAALFDRIRAASDYLISYSYGPEQPALVHLGELPDRRAYIAMMERSPYCTAVLMDVKETGGGPVGIEGIVATMLKEIGD